MKRSIAITAAAAVLSAVSMGLAFGDEVRIGGPSDKPGRTINEVKAGGPSDRPGRTINEVKAGGATDKPGRTINEVKAGGPSDKPGRELEIDPNKYR